MKGEADYHRRLSADMAEAEHRAQINALDDKSAWEELCKIRDALGEKINQPTPPRNSYQASLLKPETAYDASYQNALLKSHRGLSS
jgi:hypothetical protein